MWVKEQLEGTIVRYNAAVTDYERLVSAKEKSELEKWMVILAPFLLVGAMALRFTKVTGEIREEYKKHKGQA